MHETVADTGCSSRWIGWKKTASRRWEPDRRPSRRILALSWSATEVGFGFLAYTYDQSNGNHTDQDDRVAMMDVDEMVEDVERNCSSDAT